MGRRGPVSPAPERRCSIVHPQRQVTPANSCCRRAQQALQGPGVDHPAPLELPVGRTRAQGLGPDVDHHRGRGLGRSAARSPTLRAEGHQGIGPPGRDGQFLLTGQRRHRGHPGLDGGHHRGALGCRQLGPETEGEPAVRPPVLQEPGGLRRLGVLGDRPGLHVGPVADRRGGDRLGPGDQLGFRPGRGEPGKLHHLVDRESTGRQRFRRQGERLPAWAALTHRSAFHQLMP